MHRRCPAWDLGGCVWLFGACKTAVEGPGGAAQVCPRVGRLLNDAMVFPSAQGIDLGTTCLLSARWLKTVLRDCSAGSPSGATLRVCFD